MSLLFNMLTNFTVSELKNVNKGEMLIVIQMVTYTHNESHYHARRDGEGKTYLSHFGNQFYNCKYKAKDKTNQITEYT